MSGRLYLIYLTSAVVSLEKAGRLLLFRVEAVSRITVGGKEAINLSSKWDTAELQGL